MSVCALYPRDDFVFCRVEWLCFDVNAFSGNRVLSPPPQKTRSLEGTQPCETKGEQGNARRLGSEQGPGDPRGE